MRNGESNLQKNCVRWFRAQFPKYAPLLFAVPNGAKRDRITASILKAEGVVAGVSDLILLVQTESHPFLCIEMKYGTNKQTELQIKWQKDVESQGGKYVVCRELEQFMDVINDYLFF